MCKCAWAGALLFNIQVLVQEEGQSPDVLVGNSQRKRLGQLRTQWDPAAPFSFGGTLAKPSQRRSNVNL